MSICFYYCPQWFWKVDLCDKAGKSVGQYIYVTKQVKSHFFPKRFKEQNYHRRHYKFIVGKTYITFTRMSEQVPGAMLWRALLWVGQTSIEGWRGFTHVSVIYFLITFYVSWFSIVWKYLPQTFVEENSFYHWLFHFGIMGVDASMNGRDSKVIGRGQIMRKDQFLVGERGRFANIFFGGGIPSVPLRLVIARNIIFVQY